ncbi:MAG: outer membrane beta-barrel protein [Cyclobacteriaceae bacterium]
MLTKTIILAWLFGWFIQPALAQLSGKVIDTSGEALPFVNVLLLNAADSALAKGAITDESGTYVLEGISSGTYLLQFRALGWQTYESSSFDVADSKQKNMGIQVLSEDTQQLSEVVIRAEKPLFQQEIDRTVVNVESSMMTNGSSALQVLERSPGVSLDHQNGGIMLNGQSGVAVMINGKLMRLPVAQVVAMLNGMSADNIEKIELLTSPPAKYDAEGSAGIINIILKENEEVGTTGTLSVTGGLGVGEKAATNINLSHNSSKVNVYGSYAFLHDRSYSDLWVIGDQDMPDLGGELDVYFLNTTHLVSDNHNATLGLEAYLGNTTIRVNTAYNHSQVFSERANRGEYTPIQAPFLLMEASIDATNRWKNSNTSLFLEKDLNEGEKLNFNADYLYYKNENPSDISTRFSDQASNEVSPEGNIFANRQRGIANTPIHVGVISLDYTKQWSDKLRLETGVKRAYTRSNSLSRIEDWVDNRWVNTSRTSNNIAMRERIGAAYASSSWQISPSAELKVGVRYEYSHTYTDAEKEENEIDRRLGKLFPSLFFSKKVSDHTTWQLSYTKRISRPTYNDLASYLTYSGPMSVFTGNPLLQPTITNNVKVGYIYRGYSFSVLAGRDDYPIARFQLTENPERDLLYVAPQNLKYQNNLTFQADIPISITDWWTINQGWMGGWRQFELDYTPVPTAKTYFAYSVYGNQTIKLPRQFFVEISGWYNSPSYNGSVKVGGFGMLNVGVKKELSNNRGSFQISVTDLLQSMQIRSRFGGLTEEAFAINTHTNYRTESARSRIIKLTYSRSFGNSEASNKRPRVRRSREEENRIIK